jgi:uncharacterized protein YwgA
VDPRLVALKLVLNAVNVPTKPETLRARTKIQKAVYLAQNAGAPLGYAFGWYVKGPYSPGLTQDYYALSREDDGAEGFRLDDKVQASLSKLRDLDEVPQGVDLKDDQWLELLASLHFLHRVSRKDDEAAMEILRKQKPRLVPFAVAARDKLREMSLL